MSFHTDTRAVSVTVTHAIALGITALLMTALLLGAGSMLDSRKEAAARAQLQDIGGNFAEDITQLDNLGADGHGTRDVSLYTELPESVSGMRYSVAVKAENVAGGPGSSNEAVLYLNTTSPSVSVSVPVSNTTWIDVPERIETDEFRMRLCRGTGAPYPASGPSASQFVVFGRECP